MNYSKFIKNLRVNNTDFKSLFFFTQNRNYFELYLYVLNYHYKKQQDYSIEKIIRYMTKNQISRPTIFKIIDQALMKKFLIKEQNILDKRKFILKPSHQVIKEFEEWAKLFRNL